MNLATQFLKEAYSELKQSTWLTREQAIDSTKVVVVLVALMSLYVAGIDYVLSILVRAVLGR
ncbi:MAG TPA: preprotein translocase subunit SecE [Elusimicrobia bacterium]|nr:MAG: preprotein translocase subunit SecE [Elusimicrobia bacterium GWA2_66_18]OGR69859.1 MAG: preprotein translocase subunit SecE [Elusimicrobia bacterium GWC2_65_9]HAZ07679.1 preprotein translocase subunit SecE [Elusimicrobiota bacterium]